MASKFLWGTILFTLCLFFTGVTLYGAALLNADFSWMRDLAPKTKIRVQTPSSDQKNLSVSKPQIQNSKPAQPISPSPNIPTVETPMPNGTLERASELYFAKRNINEFEDYPVDSSITSYTNEEGDQVEIVKTPDGQQFGRVFRDGFTQSIIQKVQDKWITYHFDNNGHFLYAKDMVDSNIDVYTR